MDVPLHRLQGGRRGKQTDCGAADHAVLSTGQALPRARNSRA